MCKDKQSKMTPSPVQGKLTVLLEDVTCYRATENEEKVVGRTTGVGGMLPDRKYMRRLGGVRKNATRS